MEASLADYATEVPVKILVGSMEDTVTYYLPPTLLKQHSVYFKGCLSGSFLESHLNEIKLDDVDPSTFKYFVKWLYSKTSPVDYDALQEDDDIHCLDQHENIVVALWLLGDRFLAEQLQNDCLDKLREIKRSKVARVSVLKGIDDAPGTHKVLKRYYVKQLAYDITNHYFQSVHTQLQDEWDELNAETLRRIIADSLDFHHLATEADNTVEDKELIKDPSMRIGCLWHVHINTARQECADWKESH